MRVGLAGVRAFVSGTPPRILAAASGRPIGRGRSSGSTAPPAVPETRASDRAFEDWPLHDAIVGTFALDLETETCSLDLDVFFDRGENARPARIEWEGVTGFAFGLEYEWGHAAFVSINRQWREDGDVFVLELQTGDEVRITAKDARLQDLGAVEPTARRRYNFPAS